MSTQVSGVSNASLSSASSAAVTQTNVGESAFQQMLNTMLHPDSQGGNEE